MAFLLCLLSVLCFALGAAENGEIVETFEGLQPQQDSLPPFNKLHDSLESVNRQNLMDLIHKLSKYENGIFRQEFRETEKQGKNQKRSKKWPDNSKTLQSILLEILGFLLTSSDSQNECLKLFF